MRILARCARGIGILARCGILGVLLAGSRGVACPRFCIAHYAGEVEYSAEGMLAKNKDALSEDLQAP